MPFVVIYILNGLKYYVQLYNGEYRLNGLLDNAMIIQDEVDAIEATAQLEIMLGKPLLPMEIPPYKQLEETAI